MYPSWYVPLSTIRSADVSSLYLVALPDDDDTSALSIAALTAVSQRAIANEFAPTHIIVCKQRRRYADTLAAILRDCGIAVAVVVVGSTDPRSVLNAVTAAARSRLCVIASVSAAQRIAEFVVAADAFTQDDAANSVVTRIALTAYQFVHIGHVTNVSVGIRHPRLIQADFEANALKTTAESDANRHPAMLVSADAFNDALWRRSIAPQLIPTLTLHNTALPPMNGLPMSAAPSTIMQMTLRHVSTTTRSGHYTHRRLLVLPIELIRDDDDDEMSNSFIRNAARNIAADAPRDLSAASRLVAASVCATICSSYRLSDVVSPRLALINDTHSGRATAEFISANTAMRLRAQLVSFASPSRVYERIVGESAGSNVLIVGNLCDLNPIVSLVLNGGTQSATIIPREDIRRIFKRVNFININAAHRTDGDGGEAERDEPRSFICDDDDLISVAAPRRDEIGITTAHPIASR